MDELAPELRTRLSAAVSRCRPDAATASFLSGGLDSSTVCGMHREIAGRATPAYTIGFDAHGYDEMEYARIAARHFGLELREHYVTAEDIADSMRDIARAYDEPFGNSSAVPTDLPLNDSTTSPGCTPARSAAPATSSTISPPTTSASLRSSLVSGRTANPSFPCRAIGDPLLAAWRSAGASVTVS